MIQKKILITAIVVSLICHIALIALSNMVILGNGHSADRPFTVRLEEQSKHFEKIDYPNTRKPTGEAGPYKARPKTEDTVELGNKNTKYYDYLKHLKKKIEQHWSYPRQAYARKEKGTSVVKFSISERGNLADSCIMTSSGYESLDREALRVIQSACPFQPIPLRYNLSRLHVIARFQYSLAD